MKFEDKELELMVTRKIDKVIFYASDRPVFSVNINDLIAKKIESDPNLKKALIAQVLQSND
jgi:hypothetical protein